MYRTNIENNVKKAKKAIGLLYPIFKKYSSLGISEKIRLYKIYIRPILTYGCAVWSNSAKTHLNKIQIQQNKCLRMALNKKYSSKITDLHSSANIEYISEFIDKLSNKFYSNSLKSENNLIKRLGKYNKESLNFRVKHKLPKKL